MRAAPQLKPVEREPPSDIVVALALTVMVFFHHKIGLRLLRPGWIIGIVVALMLPYFLASTFPWWLLSFFEPESMITGVFAASFAARAWYLRQQHKEDMREGSTWSTYNPGESYLGKNWAIYRFAEPAICIAMGYFGSPILPTFLAWWFVVAGFCLFLFERHIYHVQLHRDLDVRDNVTEGEFFSAATEQFTRAPTTPGPRPGAGPASGQNDIPTGLDSDLEALRRARKG